MHQLSGPTQPVIRLAHTDELEPIRPAVLLVEPGLTVSEPSRHAAFALGRVRTVEEGDMLVANVAEPRRVSIRRGLPCVANVDKLTSGSCWHPRTSQAQYYEQERRPNARKRSLQRGQGG